MTLRSAVSDPARRRKWILYTTSAVALYAVIGFLIAPPLLRTQAEKTLAEELGREVRIGEVALNPFALSLTVRMFELRDADRTPFIEFDELYVNLQLSSVLLGAFTLSEARLESPFVHVKVLRDGTLNFSELAERLASGEEPVEAEPSGPTALLIYLAKVAEGRILFSDFSRPTPFEHEIAPLNVELRDFGTRPDDESPYSFSATTGAGEKLDWTGNFSVVPLYSSGEFAFSGIRPRTGWLYFQDDVSFEVVDGTVDFRGRYQMDARETLSVKLDDGRIELRDLAVDERATGLQPVTIPSFDIEGISIRYPEQTVQVAQIRSSGGRYQMQRLADGRFRVQRLLEKDGSVAPEKSEADPPAPAVSDTAAADTSAPEWRVVIDSIDFDSYRMEFEDLSTPEPLRLTLDPIGLHVGGLTNEPGTSAEIDLDITFQKTGRISVKGRAGADPPLAEVDIALSDIDLPSFAPYWAEQLALEMQSGSFDLSGRAVARDLGEPSQEIGFEGGLGVKALRTLDRNQGKELLSWSAVELDGLVLRVEPTSVHLKRLSLREPSAQILIDRDGSSNLQQVLIAPKEGAGEPTSNAESAEAQMSEEIPIRIDLVEIEGASTKIVDRSVTPSFSSRLTEFGGRIEGLSSEESARSKLKLEGKLNGATPMQISGVVSPLASEVYADVEVHFANFGLTPFTPYSGRYIGKAIGRGKLFLDLDYELDGNVLAGENKIFLDQFTLGEDIESDQAVDLPIGLAIGLLKDRKGEIHIDLPIRGEVDDPQFSVIGLVARALGNLITKAALAPFSLIGGLVGVDGDEMAFVEFAPGSTEISGSQRPKLTALGTALAERPGLTLEIAGAAATSLDRPVLRAAALDAQIRRARFEEMRAKWFGDKPEKIADIVVTEEDSNRLLLDAYSERFGEAPEKLLEPPDGQSADEPGDPAEDAARLHSAVRARMEEDMKVDAATLRQLARRRAQAIRDALVADGQVGAERVFMLEPVLEDTTDSPGARSAMSLAVP